VSLQFVSTQFVILLLFRCYNKGQYWTIHKPPQRRNWAVEASAVPAYEPSCVIVPTNSAIKKVS